MYNLSREKGKGERTIKNFNSEIYEVTVSDKLLKKFCILIT